MFLSRLRAATAEAHRRVARASPLLRPDLSLPVSGAYLRAGLGYRGGTVFHVVRGQGSEPS